MMKTLTLLFVRLHIKFYDAESDRFEVPLTIHASDSTTPSNRFYDVEFFNTPSFYFKVENEVFIFVSFHDVVSKLTCISCKRHARSGCLFFHFKRWQKRCKFN